MEPEFDCVLCGTCIADILVRPVQLDQPLGPGRLFHVDSIEVATGGLVSNVAIAMTRLGMRAAAVSYVGDDLWAAVLRDRYAEEGIDTNCLLTHPEASTSTTIVMIDPAGERTFAHTTGAPGRIDKKLFLDHLSLFSRSRMALVGYYSLMPQLDEQLPEILAAIRQTGCRTAMDVAGDGGGLQPLDRILPHLDVYVPSHAEAVRQTGTHDPKEIIKTFRQCGAPGLLGVKLGAQGAILSPRSDEYLPVDAAVPPGEVIDTTGAGDCFYAGLLTGLLRGMDNRQAGRLAAAAGACCVTAVGAATAIRDFAQIEAIAEE